MMPSLYPGRVIHSLLTLLLLLVFATGCGGGDGSSPAPVASDPEPTVETNRATETVVRNLISMGGAWQTWSGQDTGIYRDEATGNLVLPGVTSGQDYIYGVQEFRQALTAGNTYRLELISSDVHARTLLFLRDGNGFNVPLQRPDGTSTDIGTLTGAGSLLFIAPENITSVLVQVQAGWRATEPTRLLVRLTEANSTVSGNEQQGGAAAQGSASLIDLSGSWLTWEGGSSGISYDQATGKLIVPAAQGNSQRTGVRRYDLVLDPANEYVAYLDPSNAGATARLYLHGASGNLNYVHADNGLARDWHEVRGDAPLRFVPPAGVQAVTVQIQGPWQAVDTTTVGFSLSVNAPSGASTNTGSNAGGGNAADPNVNTGSSGGGQVIGGANNGQTGSRPRVAIITDINYSAGDPDDSQSMLHLLWYADELDVRAIIPDKWSGGGYQATMDAISAYEADYNTYGLSAKGYPQASEIRNRVAANAPAALSRLIAEADASSEPLYVLIWGAMTTLRDALYQRPDLAGKLRVLSIASAQHYDGNCASPNWNGGGRNDIFNDSRFNNMWWVESNWTYNGMFDGPRPVEMLNLMTSYGTMGWKMKDVVSAYSWAQYFRAGDTPTVLYLIDPANNLDNPQQGSWAGQFARPFPDWKPNFYADSSGGVAWDYGNPCNTWGQKFQVFNNSKATIESRRDSMYDALIGKLNWIYGR